IYELNPKLTPVNYDSPALLPPSKDMGMAYIDRMTFICDSPTYWMWPLGLFSDGKDSRQIWTGPEGTMTLAYQSSYHILDPYDKKERPIREVVALHPPDILVIALGINGISFMDEAYFTEEYKDLVTDIQAISPDTIIIFQSIYPITQKYKYYGSITNAKISAGNSWIMALAEELGCSYLDTFSVLLNDEGMAKDELMLNDGLHPNRDGLILILDYIRTHAYRGHEG
ncbi:MAG TPA: SGNH/GDSL hydrolase family protein, partial [Clostridia bacterium]|nr:SGNH/GDSL hydrolase family protein [Clostridia bacterium]